MSASFRLPDIWWTCACVACDPHDNEVTVYVDVVASVKSEALERAESRIAQMGMAYISGQAMACPERPLTLPVPQLPAPAPPAPTVTPPPAEPFFATAYFTRYADTTRMAAEGGT